MRITENNKNSADNRLGKTQTFDISSLTADDSREKINEENEKQLSGMNRAIPRNPEHRNIQSQRPEQSAVNQTQQAQPEVRQVRRRPQPSSQIEINPVVNKSQNQSQTYRNAHNTNGTNGTNGQAVNRTHPQSGMALSASQAQTQRPVSVNRTNASASYDGRTRPNAADTNYRPTAANQAASGSGSNVRVQPAQGSAQPQERRRTAQNTAPSQVRKKQDSSFPVRFAANEDKAQKPQKAEKADKSSREMMLATRKTDINALMNTPKKLDSAETKKTVVQPKVEEEVIENSDEGGNTVVSVAKAVVYIIFVAVISVFLALGIITVSNDMFAFVKSDEIVEVTIPEYATLDEVADILYKNDIIKYPKVFKLYAVSENDDGNYLAGTYSVSPMMNYDSLLAEFKEKVVYEVVDITIPEGYTTDEIIDLFVEGYGIGTREGFIDVIENYDFDYWFIDELNESGRCENRLYRLDGYLFPDTYQFYTTSSEETVINKLLKRFSQIFTKEYRNQCAEMGYSVDEMVTLASMIEKEAGSSSEFFKVSSVFHNRLNNYWSFPKLESDATVLYVLRHEAGENITLKASDLEYDTPYNTYLYDGLPPGPIANPSASAMLAALSPEKTNFYYFVSNNGQTYFSETKEQHDAYIAQFKEENQTP